MTESIVTAALDANRVFERARAVLALESQAVADLANQLDDGFVQACQLILTCRGRVVVSGMGKSGHIARKIAATLASTGTPAFYVHPAEASHGDLGMVTRDDVLLCLSNSGQTQELLNIIPGVRRQGAILLAMTGDGQSPLAKLADVHLSAKVTQEACPFNLAPTASTTAALALGDALAVVLLDARGFKAEDFARSHPGGALGRRLLTRVGDVMRTGDAIPRVTLGAPLATAILEVTHKRLGMTTVLTPDGQLAGIFTDGDLRRILEKHANLSALHIDDVMMRNPHTIAPDALAATAVRLMEEKRITVLVVTDAHSIPVGALHLHDLLLARVV